MNNKQLVVWIFTLASEFHFLIASQVNKLYSKASTPYAIQLHFTLAMALENKNVSFTYLVHKKILHAKYSLKGFGNRCYLCLFFFHPGRQTHSDSLINQKKKMKKKKENKERKEKNRNV